MCIGCSWACSKSLSCSLVEWRQLYLVVLSFKWFFSSLFHLRQAIVRHVPNSRFHVHYRFALRFRSLHLFQGSVWMCPAPCYFGSTITYCSAILVHDRLRIIMISDIVEGLVVMIVDQFKILKIIDGLNAFKHIHLSFNEPRVLLGKSILVIFFIIKIKLGFYLVRDLLWWLTFPLLYFWFWLAHVLNLRQLFTLIH